MSKVFKIKSEDIVPGLASGLGCLATDRITVDGCRVQYMYRDKQNNEMDSGWRFFAGDEDDEYMANNKNHEVYKLNTIANYDRDIIEFLGKPEGSEFERDDSGNFIIARTH